jgi:periplasmic copper chaperone A
MTRHRIALLAAAFIASGAIAHDYDLKSLHIDHPVTRATPPGAKSAGAFMTIENGGTDADRLIGASSVVANIVQIHEMSMDGAVMKMREVKGIELKPGSTVALKPGSFHVMMSELKQPLKEGDEFPMTLTFEKAGSIDVKVKVEAMGGGSHQH